MSQTMTSIANLIASEFQDGQVNAISAQRVRDLIVSLNIPWVVATGTGDALTLPFTYPVTAPALVDGFLIACRASAPNTITNPTINPSSLGTAVITARGGLAVVAGDIPRAGYECLFRYNTAGPNWELLNPAGASYVFSEVLIGAHVSMTSNTATDITTVSLGAGDWELEGNLAFDVSSGTLPTRLAAWIHTVTAAEPTKPNKGSFTDLEMAFTASTPQVLPVGKRRLSLGTGPTTVYLSGIGVFTVSTLFGYGYLQARRIGA